MTTTMCRNYELFGEHLCFDMIKRGINTLLWLYTSVALYDETNSVCLANEGFVTGEKIDTYLSKANFLARHAPRRPLSEVKIVPGDGFLDEEIVTRLGFINAAFVADQWHLLDSGLKKMVGKAGHALIGTHLARMVTADMQLNPTWWCPQQRTCW